MDGKKAYKTFNFAMLGVVVFIALALIFIIFFTKSSLFSKLDSHGCDSSKGYAYSYARNQCVLVYEVAISLEKTHPVNRNELKAFVIFSFDNKSADVFLPDRIYALLNMQEENTLWVDNKSYYSLKNSAEKLSLQENGTEIYYINR